MSEQELRHKMFIRKQQQHYQRSSYLNQKDDDDDDANLDNIGAAAAAAATSVTRLKRSSESSHFAAPASLPKYVKPKICKSSLIVQSVSSKRVAKPQPQLAIIPPFSYNMANNGQSDNSSNTNTNRYSASVEQNNQGRIF
jgi:hypothetical protein